MADDARREAVIRAAHALAKVDAVFKFTPTAHPLDPQSEGRRSKGDPEEHAVYVYVPVYLQDLAGDHSTGFSACHQDAILEYMDDAGVTTVPKNRIGDDGVLYSYSWKGLSISAIKPIPK